MSEVDTKEKKGGNGQHGQHDFVVVIVDNVDKKIEPGAYIVSAFKVKVGVDPAKELDQIVKGVLKPLADDATIVIEGHERFVSHVRTGGSA